MSLPSQSDTPEKTLLTRIVLPVISVFLAVWVLIFIVATWRWPLAGDASLIRYAVFLTQHGFAPYRDILDINMPGAYLTDWLVVHLFGDSSAGWRIFDFLLIAAAGLSMQSIAGKGLRLIGWIAAGVLLLLHGRDGVPQAGQRDLVMAVLLLGAYACLYRSIHRNIPLWTGMAGFLASWAATIKPTVLPFVLVLAVFSAILLRNRSHALRHAAWGAAGTLLPFAAVFLYLWKWHSLRAFWCTLQGIVRVHAGLDRRSLAFLLIHSVSPIMIVVALWAVVAWRQNWRQWERTGLALAIGFGLFSYVLQGKGYPYHRYPLLAFLLLIMGIDFAASLRGTGWRKWIAAAAGACVMLYFVPVSVIEAARYDSQDQEFITTLRGDLKDLGGQSLSGRIQCLDTTAGCVTTLYRMRLVQATGLLYDCYVLMPHQTPATLAIRRQYLAEWQSHPPEIFIVSDQMCLSDFPGFAKLQNWPDFHQFLQQHYVPRTERTPPAQVKWWSGQRQPRSYRMYIRRKEQETFGGGPG
jgi:hypothetical protein